MTDPITGLRTAQLQQQRAEAEHEWDEALEDLWRVHRKALDRFREHYIYLEFDLNLNGRTYLPEPLRPRRVDADTEGARRREMNAWRKATGSIFGAVSEQVRTMSQFLQKVSEVMQETVRRPERREDYVRWPPYPDGFLSGRPPRRPRLWTEEEFRTVEKKLSDLRDRVDRDLKERRGEKENDDD